MFDLADLTLCSAVLEPAPMAASPDSLAMQVAAARGAGFAGISLWNFHVDAAIAGGQSAEAVREQVLGSGLRVPMVEALLPFELPDDATAIAAAAPVLATARDYGAPYVVAVSMTGPPDPKATAARLRALCDPAADLGLTVLIEFLPWSAIPDLATARDVLEESARDNVGLVFDAWHWQRQPGGPCPEVLRSFPAERIKVFQICDVAPRAAGPPLEECTTARLLPGDGVVDFRALLGLFREIGAEPLVAPEVFDAEALRVAGANERAKQIAAATKRVLADHAQ